MGFITALLLAAQPISSLGNRWRRIDAEGLAAAERFYGSSTRSRASSTARTRKPLAVHIGHDRFDDVGFAYATAAGLHAVTDFSLDRAGRQDGGARRALGRRQVDGDQPRAAAVRRDTGRILIDGQDLRDVTLASLRDAISIVARSVTLFDDTIRANIALGRLGAPRSRASSPPPRPRPRTSSSWRSRRATTP